MTSDQTDTKISIDDYLAALPEGAGRLNEKMGVELVEISADRVVGTMPVEGNTQPYGLLHGGASVARAETLGSVGAAVVAGQDRSVVGIEINASHHRAARTGRVTGVASVVQAGRTLTTWEVVITDDDGRRVCTSRITCLLRDNPPGG
jgi:1,4-dihydroxy-2-naphthoyl-CoA hydrolase